MQTTYLIQIMTIMVMFGGGDCGGGGGGHVDAHFTEICPSLKVFFISKVTLI